jgi:hypothetical protein
MRVPAPVIKVATLAMFHPWQFIMLRRTVAFELVRDEYPWHRRQAFEELAEKLLRLLLVPPTLHQDIEHVIVLVHRSP